MTKDAQKKAAQTRARNAAKRVWSEVKKSKSRTGCTCPIHQGMTIADLRPLNAGCTTPVWVCPTLALYRRYVDRPAAREAA